MNEYEKYVPKEEKFMKERKKGLLLSDYQEKILIKKGINPNKYQTFSELLFALNEIEDFDDEFEELLNDIEEKAFYSEVKQ